MNRPPAASTWLILMTLASAQQDASPPPPPAVATFALPAGPLELGDLLARIEATCGGVVQSSAELRAKARKPLFTLQHRLDLPLEVWRDVVGALLWANDLALLNEGGKLTLEPMPTTIDDGDGDDEVLGLIGTQRSAAEILAHPRTMERATVRLATKTSPDLLVFGLRPALALAGQGGQPFSLDFDLSDGRREVVLRGLTPHVAQVLRLVMLADGQPVPAAEQPTWPAIKVCRWPAGELPPAELLRRLAQELEANVLWQDAHLPAEAIELSCAADLPPRALWAAAATALAERGLALSIVHAPTRIFVVVPATQRYRSIRFWRAPVMTVEEATDPQLPRQPILAIVPTPKGAFDSFRNLRTKAEGDDPLYSGIAGRSLFLQGPSDVVREQILQLRQPGPTGR